MKIIKTVFGRVSLTLLAVLLELVLFYGLLQRIQDYLGWMEILIRILSILILLLIINYSRHLSSDLMWIIVIGLVPIGGTVLYLFLEIIDRISSKTYKNIVKQTDYARKYFHQDPEVYREAMRSAGEQAGQLRYISEHAGFPVYRNSGFQFFELGELGWHAMLTEMEKAEKFIFLEYFIIEEGEMWDRMLSILKKKADAGVDVRVLYDDMGSFQTLPARYVKHLQSMGIKAVAFNRINPILSGIMNHRDHRKILVVDGRCAFSGGINLADEYINVKKIHGHWKDNCIEITGEAVWSYTVLFLTTWNALYKEDEDYTRFCMESVEKREDGFIAPYGESPLDDQNVGQNIYLNILNQAKDYVYITTPYLIIDTDMINALILAAERGVDVRIITPGVPDKKIVWNVTRSYYPILLKNGVKIYEYTPGFIHSKTFICDDRIATVGTLNLDYRSLYLHFENGTYLFESEEILNIKKDFQKTESECTCMDPETNIFGPIRLLFYQILRIFAPMF